MILLSILRMRVRMAYPSSKGSVKTVLIHSHFIK